MNLFAHWAGATLKAEDSSKVDDFSFMAYHFIAKVLVTTLTCVTPKFVWGTQVKF